MYSSLALCYEKTNDYKNAFENYKKYTAVSDSIRSRENIRKATEQMMTYEFEKKEEANRLEQEKKDAVAEARQWVLIIGLVLTLILVFVIYRSLRSKRKSNAKLTVQKEELQNALSKLKSTQSQLIQAEKMASLGELTAGIAHEIQNPLNFVNNFSEVSKEMLAEMQDEISDNNFENVRELANDVIKNLDKIYVHGKRAEGIVKGMLQHTRTENELKEPTNINTLADEYFRLAYHGLRAKDKSFNATLETDFDNTIGKVSIVRNDMGRVILNLITNAFFAVDEKRKFGEADYKPTVTIRTRKLGEKVEVTVQDNGNGIPKAVLDKIFQPFFTTKPPGQGTGLGLSLSYDIITRHKGKLTVETDEGVGTAFIVELPINSENANNN